MVTLLYHAKTVGFVCKRIAALSDGTIGTLCDRKVLPPKIEGTLIRWDSTADLDADLIFNSADSVELSRHKRESRIELEGLCPPTYTRLMDVTYPCILRPKRHYAAQGFYICNDPQEGRKAAKACGLANWYASPIIEKKLEYRVFVFNGYVLKVVRRFHDDPTQLAWNIANGGKSKRVKWGSWPIPIVNLAIEAGERLGLDWYATDIIVGADDKAYVLELNTAPGLDRDKTLSTMARVFSSDAPKRGEKVGQTWQDLKHPAVR